MSHCAVDSFGTAKRIDIRELRNRRHWYCGSLNPLGWGGNGPKVPTRLAFGVHLIDDAQLLANGTRLMNFY